MRFTFHIHLGFEKEHNTCNFEVAREPLHQVN